MLVSCYTNKLKQNLVKPGLTICGKFNFNILPQISHTFYRIKRNNEVLFLLIWMFKILNIAFYGVMGSMANKSTMFSKQSLIRLYKLVNKGFVQYGQAFFLCFAPILPPISKFQFVLIIEVAQTKLN